MAADALGTPAPAATPTVGVVSDEDHRLAMAGMVAPQSSTLAVRTGVMWGPNTTALVTGTSATGTMTVGIAIHHAVTTRGTADGVYLGPTLDAATTVNIAAAPGSNSRIDVVYVKQNDTASTISPDTGSTQPLYGVVAGTAAVSPTKPSIPVGALELATVTVAAGATSTNGAGVTITNTSVQTVARGADIPCRTATERDAITKFVGLSVKRLDDGGRVERWTGSAWAAAGDVPVLASISARDTYFSGNLRPGASALVAGVPHTYDGLAWRFILSGRSPGTGDANARIAIAHGAGQAPVSFGSSVPTQTSDLITQITKFINDSSDATNLIYRIARTDNNTWFAGNPVTIDWWARF